MSDNYENISALITYVISGNTHQSAGSASDKEYDFLDFLGVAQSLKVDFLPITWQPALDNVGEGGTAVIRQALINLQMSFTFKHLKHPRSAEEKARNWAALIAELSILGHPAIRHHPNVANIAGICWDVVRGGEEVWPVLVFEKTRYGNFDRFMTSGPGNELDSRHRLDMLFDVALAVRDLHATGIIHGDIKHENILIWSEKDGRYLPQVMDFGYSTLFTNDSDLITMPYTELWVAPEWHHGMFLPIQARKMDAYSFGLLCLWLLFYNKGADRDRKFEKDLEDSQKEPLHHASELLRATKDLENWEKDNMQNLFRSTLAQDPAERTANFDELLELLSTHRAWYLASAVDQISIPHEEFQITPSLNQLIRTHYGVRCYIAKCLKKREDRSSTSQCHALNLAICYELGLGVSRDKIRCRSMLSKHDIPIKDLQQKIEQIKKITKSREIQNGVYRRFLEQGHFQMIDFSQQYREEQRSREAEPHYQREVETMGFILGDGHVFVQEIRRQLLLLIRSEGRWGDVEKLLVQMIELDEKGIDKSSPWDTYLASTYSDQGRWKEAEDLIVQVMEKTKKRLGVEHQTTLTTMEHLASTYRDQGRWKEAENLQVQVVETRKKVLGLEHPMTLTSISILASIYLKQDWWQKAEELQVQVVEKRKKVLGVEHPHTLTSMNNLAITYSYQRRLKETEDLNVQVLETTKRVLGMEHPSTLNGIANLASTYWDLGRYKEANDLEVQVIETDKRVLGMEHPKTLISMGNLASTYRTRGLYEEAEKLEVQVMKTSKRVLGAEHPDTLTSINNLARTYWSQSRWKEAEELQVQVMETRKKALGGEHPSALDSIASLASTYWSQGRWKEAEDLQVQIMETAKKALGVEHPYTLGSMTNLAMTYWGLKRWIEAKELEMQILETSKRTLGIDHPDTLSSMNLLETISRSHRQWEEQKAGDKSHDTTNRLNQLRVKLVNMIKIKNKTYSLEDKKVELTIFGRAWVFLGGGLVLPVWADAKMEHSVFQRIRTRKHRR